MTTIGNKLLKIDGLCSFSIVSRHIAVIITGLPAYRFFEGIGDELTDLMEPVSIIPSLITGGLAFVFYRLRFFSTDVIRRLPGLFPVLISIGVIYLLRGLINIPYYWSTFTSTSSTLSRENYFLIPAHL